MIISASRRTDIPTFYGKWFLNRLKAGFVYVRNPMVYHSVSTVNLKPDAVDGIIFWTKNAIPFMPFQKEISDMGYHYYFQYTITSYNQIIEPHVIKKSAIIDNFIELSTILGKDAVIWRYDPIILTSEFDHAYHVKYFEWLCNKLHKYTNKVIISIVDNMPKFKSAMPVEAYYELIMELMVIASHYNLAIETCAEHEASKLLNITETKCIDAELLSKLRGIPIKYKKDPTQRMQCLCTKAFDIGVNSSCHHDCLYCYADKTPNNKIQLHDVNSPFLLGNQEDGDKIYPMKITQPSLF